MSQKVPILDRIRAGFKDRNNQAKIAEFSKRGMIVRDMIGNRISEGMALFWRSSNLFVEVESIHSGGIAIPGTNELTPGELVLRVKLPLDPKMQEQHLKDFLAIKNPAEEVQLASILGESSPSRGLEEGLERG